MREAKRTTLAGVRCPSRPVFTSYSSRVRDFPVIPGTMGCHVPSSSPFSGTGPGTDSGTDPGTGSGPGASDPGGTPGRPARAGSRGSHPAPAAPARPGDGSRTPPEPPGPPTPPGPLPAPPPLPRRHPVPRHPAPRRSPRRRLPPGGDPARQRRRRRPVQRLPLPGRHPLARDGEVNRENVRLDRIPLSLQQAVLAAEERDFSTSRAVDPKAMVRAAWNTVTGKGRQSGSTITQQYVKNYYLGQEQTLSRKAKEFFIAIRLGREKSKQEILQGYLNTSYFGRNAYGVQAAARLLRQGRRAARHRRGRLPRLLLKAPSAYDVTTHPENRDKAVARWHYVLDGMVTEGWLDQPGRAALRFPDPQTARPVTALSGQRGYVVQAVEEYLTSHGVLDEKTLAGGASASPPPWSPPSRRPSPRPSRTGSSPGSTRTATPPTASYGSGRRPSTRRTARSSPCTAGSTTPASTSTTPPAATTRSAPPSSPSSSRRPCRAAPRPSRAGPSPRPRCTTGPTGARWRAGAAARTTPPTRTTRATARSPSAPPPTCR